VASPQHTPEPTSRTDAAGSSLPPGLRAHLAELFPGARVDAVKVLGPDDAAHGEGETSKQIGYGKPLRITLAMRDGTCRDVVLHTASPDEYGHDRRADRIAAQVLSLDTFELLPWHVRAIDAGALRADGALVSLLGTGEGYLITEWAEGVVYAEDLRRIARTGRLDPADVDRADVLARYLAELHRAPGSHQGAYVRAIRDLVGHGEGIAGIADGYPEGPPGAPRARIEAIERACLEWRFRLRDRAARLRRTHGDFHPFNLLFDGTRLTVLDTSRGSEGDPADDVAALTINHLFFGLEHRARWTDGLGALWGRTFDRYFESGGDRGVLDVIAPFYAWRSLVLASPRWYPKLGEADRDRILRFAERVLAAERFDPSMGSEAMA
jgi:hypothetical protein